MKKNSVEYQTHLQILKEELVPAMGCTEPISIAYAASKVREVLGFDPQSTTIEVCGNIIKNVKSVVVPNTGGLKGIKAAVAAGYISAKPTLVLEVLSQLKPEDSALINKFLSRESIEIVASKKPYKFYIDVTGRYEDKSARVVILNYHTNIVLIEKNGAVIFRSGEENDDSLVHVADRSILTIKSIVDFADSVDIDDVAQTVLRQVECNLKIAEEGLRSNYSSSVGKTLLDFYGNDVKTRAKAYPAAGSDARMGGCDLPVVIVSGSGNQGMTASLPVYQYALELKVSKEKMIRAIVVSDLVTIDEKRGIGRLSAFCGAVSAGCGAAAGICYLHGGDYYAICNTIKNSLGIASGMVCDGAKASCAAKISSAVDAGLLGFFLQDKGRNFLAGDGIIAEKIDDTIDNIGKVARDGMQGTDEEILRIMVRN